MSISIETLPPAPKSDGHCNARLKVFIQQLLETRESSHIIWVLELAV